jgi:hypothetical protein
MRHRIYFAPFLGKKNHSIFLDPEPKYAQVRYTRFRIRRQKTRRPTAIPTNRVTVLASRNAALTTSNPLDHAYLGISYAATALEA